MCEGSWKMKLFPGTSQMWPHAGPNSDQTCVHRLERSPEYFKHDCEYSPLYILTKVWAKISNLYSSSTITVSPVLAYFIIFSLFSILNNGFLTATIPLRQFLIRFMKTVDEPTGALLGAVCRILSFSYRNNIQILVICCRYSFMPACSSFVLQLSCFFKNTVHLQRYPTSLANSCLGTTLLVQHTLLCLNMQFKMGSAILLLNLVLCPCLTDSSWQTQCSENGQV